MTHTYRSDDVQQILQRAMARKQEEEFSQEQLLEMAAELGISKSTLQSVEQEWLTQRQALQEQQTLKTRQRQRFKAHAIPYLAVNTFLILLNLITSPTHFWAIYPLTGWGLGLALHGRCTYQSGGTNVKRYAGCSINADSITT